jgi:ribosome-associated toxin RatA of RatAB toxin-antitoxin module
LYYLPFRMFILPALPPETRRQSLSGRLSLAWLLALGMVASALARPGSDISVSAAARDGAVEITARAVVRAPAELIWQTLTDYDHLSEFIPGMDSSHVVSRQGGQLVVEQKGNARAWFFSYPIRVMVASTEHPYQGIDVHLLQGNLRRLDGGYRIEPQPDGSTQLTWQGLVEPDTPLPAFIRAALLRRSISDQFTGMVREIERRADLWSARSALSR